MPDLAIYDDDLQCTIILLYTSGKHAGLVYVSFSKLLRLVRCCWLVQVDGEPWMQQACEMKLVLHNQATMLAANDSKWATSKHLETVESDL